MRSTFTAGPASGIAPSPVDSREPEFVVEATKGWGTLDLREIWAFRELLYFLVWRNLKARFKQTAIGVSWVILQPLITMVLFTVFFGRLANMPSDGIPYPLFAYTALLPWQMFAHAVGQSGNSLVTNQELVRKIYFPRILIPLGTVIEGLVDFLLAFIVFLGFMVYYQVAPTGRMTALPLLILLALLTALAVGVWLSALNVRYRDVRHTIPFIVQIWLIATPIVYPTSMIPEGWRMLYGLNPMVGVVEGFRWALLGNPTTLHPSVFVSIGVTAILLVAGLFYFGRMERTFADEI